MPSEISIEGEELSGSSTNTSDVHTVMIVGPQRLNNELLGSYIESAAGIKCYCSKSISSALSVCERRSHHASILLCDLSAEENWQQSWGMQKKTVETGKQNEILSAVFNVSKNKEVEGFALRRGVRGVFYQDDSAETIVKGIKAIFAGELWVQRRVLERCLTQGSPANGAESNTEVTVTERESEVLALIVIGAKNEEIAEKLCISPHTVKTHIYNIFKKIGVPNRLQAALWATKNLK